MIIRVYVDFKLDDRIEYTEEFDEQVDDAVFELMEEGKYIFGFVGKVQDYGHDLVGEDDS